MNDIKNFYQSDSDTSESSSSDDFHYSDLRTDTEFYLKWSGQKSFGPQDDWPEESASTNDRENHASTSNQNKQNNQNGTIGAAMMSSHNVSSADSAQNESSRSIEQNGVQHVPGGIGIPLSAPTYVLINNVPVQIAPLPVIDPANISIPGPSQLPFPWAPQEPPHSTPKAVKKEIPPVKNIPLEILDMISPPIDPRPQPQRIEQIDRNVELQLPRFFDETRPVTQKKITPPAKERSSGFKLSISYEREKEEQKRAYQNTDPRLKKPRKAAPGTKEKLDLMEYKKRKLVKSQSVFDLSSSPSSSPKRKVASSSGKSASAASSRANETPSNDQNGYSSSDDDFTHEKFMKKHKQRMKKGSAGKSRKIESSDMDEDENNERVPVLRIDTKKMEIKKPISKGRRKHQSTSKTSLENISSPEHEQTSTSPKSMEKVSSSENETDFSVNTAFQNAADSLSDLTEDDSERPPNVSRSLELPSVNTPSCDDLASVIASMADGIATEIMGDTTDDQQEVNEKNQPTENETNVDEQNSDKPKDKTTNTAEIAMDLGTTDEENCEGEANAEKSSTVLKPVEQSTSDSNQVTLPENSDMAEDEQFGSLIYSDENSPNNSFNKISAEPLPSEKGALPSAEEINTAAAIENDDLIDLLVDSNGPAPCDDTNGDQQSEPVAQVNNSDDITSENVQSIVVNLQSAVDENIQNGIISYLPDDIESDHEPVENGFDDEGSDKETLVMSPREESENNAGNFAEEILVVTTTAQENLPENDESNNNLFHPDFVEEVAVNGTNVEQMLSLQIEPCTLSTNADVPEIINGIHAEEAAVGGFEKHEPPRASIPQEAEEPVDIKPIISDMEPVVDNKNDPVLLKARLEALKQCNDKICVILSSDSEDETKARPRASRFRQLNVSAFIDLGDSD